MGHNRTLFFFPVSEINTHALDMGSSTRTRTRSIAVRSPSSSTSTQFHWIKYDPYHSDPGSDPQRWLDEQPIIQFASRYLEIDLRAESPSYSKFYENLHIGDYSYIIIKSLFQSAEEASPEQLTRAIHWLLTFVSNVNRRGFQFTDSITGIHFHHQLSTPCLILLSPYFPENLIHDYCLIREIYGKFQIQELEYKSDDQFSLSPHKHPTLDL